MRRQVLICLLLLLTIHCYSSENKKERKTIIVNNIILPKTETSYMEVRHIVLQGTNTEIGCAIGEIAQTWLKLVPNKYTNMLYAKARNKYMLNNYPFLYSRMIGVGNAYNVPFNNTLFDLSSLPYALNAYSCTAVKFPSNIMKNNCEMIVRNNGSYLSSWDDMFGSVLATNSLQLFAKNFVMEIYPNIGYSSITFGSFDLLNGVFDGLNSAGLYVGCMVVDNAAVRYDYSSGGKMTGLTMLQAAHQILDTCSTVEEAKVLLLSSKVSNVLVGIHMLVADKEGNSFIFEQSSETEKAQFTSSYEKTQIMTNFNSYIYPNQSHFPKSYEKQTENPFCRYDILSDEINKKQEKKLTQDDIWDMMSKVYINCIKTPEGFKYEIPFRTLWKVMINQDTLECKIIFYLNDKQNEKGRLELNFSKPFKFKLGKLKKKIKKPSQVQNI